MYRPTYTCKSSKIVLRIIFRFIEKKLCSIKCLPQNELQVHISTLVLHVVSFSANATFHVSGKSSTRFAYSLNNISNKSFGRSLYCSSWFLSNVAKLKRRFDLYVTFTWCIFRDRFYGGNLLSTLRKCAQRKRVVHTLSNNLIGTSTVLHKRSWLPTLSCHTYSTAAGRIVTQARGKLIKTFRLYMRALTIYPSVHQTL